MLKSLRFVQGAVAKKDFSPALTHFRIEDGFIKGFNGKIGLCCPIDLDLNVSPRAIPFVKAVATCKETVALHVTPAGKLALKSGTFKAFIECIEGAEYPDIQPEGDMIELNDDEFLPALKKLAPFVATDASRPWATGILLRGSSAFATNNIVAIEYWLGYEFPVEVNIPSMAIKELLRIKEEPTHLQLTDTSCTFHFSEGKWLRTQLLDLQWPDISKVIDTECNPIKIPDLFYEAFEALKPFTDDLGRVYMYGNRLATSDVDGDGAVQDSPIPLPEEACFNCEQVMALGGIAHEIDFTQYPSACGFYGDNIRGVLIGIRI